MSSKVAAIQVQNAVKKQAQELTTFPTGADPAGIHQHREYLLSKGIKNLNKAERIWLREHASNKIKAKDLEGKMTSAGASLNVTDIYWIKLA